MLLQSNEQRKNIEWIKVTLVIAEQNNTAAVVSFMYLFTIGYCDTVKKTKLYRTPQTIGLGYLSFSDLI